MNGGKITVNKAETVYHTWSVAGELLSALEEANGDAAALKYDAIAYSGNYYGSTGVKTINYALDTYSYIVTTGTNNAWQCQIQIPNNQGVGEGKNNQGVYVYVASDNNTQKLTFTAPVHGIYNFVPTAIGGPNAIEESIAVNNGSLTVGVNVKGESIGEMTLARGEKANLPEAKGVELEEGETIEVTFTASTTSTDALLYKFTIMSSGNAQVIQSYSVDNTCTWLPTKAGTYTVRVEAIGENNFGMYDFRGSETIVVA